MTFRSFAFAATSSLLAFASAACSDDNSSDGENDAGGGTAGTMAGTGGDSGSSGTGGSAGSGATGGSSGSGGTGCPSAEPGPDRVCETPVAYLGSITTPSPLISLGRPVVTSGEVAGAERLVDGLYHNGMSVDLGAPAEDEPVTVAIDLEPGPSRVLLLWTDGGYTPYNALTGGAPLAYRIETSEDSTDGEDGTWTEVAAVQDNAVRVRAHSFDFVDQRWVRLVILELPENATAARLDELEIHDLSESGDERPEDTWFLFGDSITQGAFYRDHGQNAFDALLASEHGEFSPVFLSAGVGGALLGSLGVGRIDQYLEINPDVRHFGIAFGTNDAWGNKTPEAVLFETNLRTVVEAALDAGRVPLLATIPFATGAEGACSAHRTLPDFNEIIDRLSAEYELPCGPDLYAWFRDHPEELSSDGVHPNTSGYRSINRLWAEAASPLYAGN